VGVPIGFLESHLVTCNKPLKNDDSVISLSGNDSEETTGDMNLGDFKER
jgi:hypothetical protein